MSFLGSSPTVGRPTRRMEESCLSESSGISEKLVFFDFIPFSLFAARASRADDPRDFFIVISPYCIRDNQDSAQTTFCQAQSARFTFRVLHVFTIQSVLIKKRRGSFFERYPVLGLLLFAFRGSQSNTYYVYTICGQFTRTTRDNCKGLEPLICSLVFFLFLERFSTQELVAAGGQDKPRLIADPRYLPSCFSTA